MLLFAQVLGGRAALLHAHDQIGPHFHVRAAPPAESTTRVMSAWHHSQHDEHQHPITHVPSEEHEGVMIELHPVLAAGPGANVTRATMTAHLQALQAKFPFGVASLHPPPLPSVVRAEFPQVRRQRSGTAILLGSSRALLI